jgi:TolB-like protein/Flp pilus assembly protein TadD
MEEHAEADAVRFSGFRFDRRRRVLSRQYEDGQFVPVPIGSRALDILGLLIDRHGDLVSRDEILEAVWPGVVEGANVTVQISALRRALDNGRSDGSLIQTIPGRGYRFVAPVERTDLRTQIGRAPSAHRSDHPLPRLSIVVLPFVNLSADTDQQYFGDAITDDITTDLSRLANMVVISRHTAFTYRNKPIDTKQIGRELSVRYVLEGSVRRSGKQVRVNAQLVDAETDTHLWAERLDGDTADLFALQDEITARIAVALNLELIGAEAARRSEHPGAMDLLLRARAAAIRPATPEIRAERLAMLERALAIDPGSIEVQSWLANALGGRVAANMTETPEADLVRAEELVGRALASSPRCVAAHNARGQLLRAQGRFAEAIPEYEMVLAVDRNWVNAYFGLGQSKLHTGAIEETIPLVERAIRLSPRDPELGVWFNEIGVAHLLQWNTEGAITWFQRARNAIPAHSKFRSFLAAAYALRGDGERAAAELAEARRLSPDDRYSSLVRLRTFYNFDAPKIRALREAAYFSGLRKAGMPEE